MAYDSKKTTEREIHPPCGMPERIEVNGRVYRLVVFMVHSRHYDGIGETAGTPALCKLLKDGAIIDLQGEEHFMTAYVPDKQIRA